jgi:hypothetical protein
VNALATSISNKTGVDDEAIQSAANLLLTFKNVQNAGIGQAAMFDRATAAALDLSKSGFGSLDSSAKMLGKALNDPSVGMTALSRAGVTFTASQKEQIKALQDSGNLLGAQAIIMREVESQVGGAAAAMATPFERFQTSLQNVQEQIGNQLLPIVSSMLPTILPLITAVGNLTASFVTGLLPVLQPVLSILGSLAGFVTANVSAIRDLIVVVGGSIAVFKIAGAATALYRGIMQAYAFATYEAAASEGTMTFAQYARAAATRVVTQVQTQLNAAMASNPIGVIIVAVAALVAGMVLLFKHSQRFRNFIATSLPVLGKIFGGLFAGILHGIAFLIRGWVQYATFFTGLADKIIGVAQKAFGWIPGIGDAIATARRQFNNIRNTILDSVSAAADGVDNLAHKINIGVQNSAAGLAEKVNDYGKDATKAAKKQGNNAGKAYRTAFNTGVTTGTGAATSRVKAPKTASRAPRTTATNGTFIVSASGGGLSLSVTVNGSVVQEKDITRTIRNELIQFGKRVGNPVALGV